MNKRFLMGVLRDPEPEQGGGGELPPVPQDPPQDTERQQMLDRLAKLERAAEQRPVPVQPQQPAAPQNDAAAQKKAMEAEYWKDPLAFLQKYGQYVTQQTLNSVAPMLEGNARDQVRKSDPELFDALQAEIEANMQGLDPQLRANATIWMKAFEMARGQNIDKVLAIKGKKESNVQDGPITPSHRTPPAPRRTALSEDQQLFIKKFKLNEDQYRQGLEFHNNQEAMWDKVITFDSQTSMRSVDAGK
jgi:hypothetical protein